MNEPPDKRPPIQKPVPSEVPDFVPVPPAQARPQYVRAKQPPTTNAWGVAGFVLSLIGLVLGIVTPVGLFVSAKGVEREPRGLAISGVILGLLGTAALVYTVWPLIW